MTSRRGRSRPAQPGRGRCARPRLAGRDAGSASLDGRRSRPPPARRPVGHIRAYRLAGLRPETWAITVTGTSWLDKARGDGFLGIDLAARVLLPIPPNVNFDGRSHFDEVLKQFVADPAYNLK